MAAVANPTGVSSFTGVSDERKGAAHFQSLFDHGAFEPDADRRPPLSEQLAERRPAEPQRHAETPPPQPVQEPESQTPPAPEPPVEAPAAAEEGPEYRDLDDYLTQAKIERESFLAMPVAVKVDGKTETVPLKELMDGYSREGNYTRRSQELANQKRDWDTQQAQARQVVEQNLAAAQGLFQLAQQSLVADFQGYEQLQTTDPLRYLQLKDNLQARMAGIQGHLQNLANQRAQAQQQQQARDAQNLEKEFERMYELMPQWRDEQKFAADRQDMMTMGQQLGFSTAELSQISDHRYMQALHYASQFLKLQAQAPQAVKRVRAAPQMAAPGARTVRDPSQVAYTQAKERWKKNPKDQSAGQAYFDQLARSLE
jgi:hypothetical protein